MATKITVKPPNSFQWVAEYDGGEIFSQYGAPGRTINDFLELSAEGRLDRLHVIRLVEGREDDLDIEPRFTVDLHTGFFYINGQKEDRNPRGVPIRDLKPIYYRTVRGGYGTGGGSYRAYVKWYKLGWQMHINGKNYQRIILYDVPGDTYEFVEKR